MPSRGLFALELPRAGRELMARVLATPQLRGAPRGDGHPVLVLPGFTGSDNSTRVMRAYLRRLGYYVHAWRLGRNWGPTDRIIDGLAERFLAVSKEHGRKLSLIGHSLGGIYARELARRAPDLVRAVITLGTPVRLGGVVRSNVTPLYRTVSSRHSERVRGAAREGLEELPPGVPVTAIVTRTDGVVDWRVCTVDAGPLSECIEVRGSHTGLIHNVAALHVVADRLALPEGAWEPFAARRGVGARIWTPSSSSA